MAIFYAVLVAMAYLFQNRLLYYPAQYTIEDAKNLAAAVGLKPWPGEAYRGFVPQEILPREQVHGTVIVVHGNAGSAIDRFGYVKALQPLGFRVFLYEYPGYGAREGSSGEKSIVTDLREVIRLLEDDNAGPIYLFAESLGCGVAAATAADPSLPVRGLVLVAPWDELAHVAQSHYPFLPVKWLLKDRYDSVKHLSTFRGPVVVACNGRDEVIPTELQQRLYESLTGPRKLIFFADSTHNGWPSNPDATWWKEAMEFATDSTLPVK